MAEAASTLRKAGFSIGGQVGARLLALLFYAALARTVGEALYGDIGVGSSLGVLFAVFMEPGLNALMIRDGSRDFAGLRARASETLGYKIVMLLLAWPAMIGLGALLGYRGTTLWAIIFAGGQILLVAFENWAAAVLTAIGRMDLEGSLHVIAKAMFAGTGLVAIALHASFETILIVLTIAQAAGGLAGIAFLHQAEIAIPLSLSPLGGARRLSQAWPLAVAGMLMLVTLRLDQVLASQLGVPSADIGDYNAAVKLVEALILFPSAIAMTFSPMISRTWLTGVEECSIELRLGLGLILSVTLPLALGGAALGSELTHVIYGAGFKGCDLPLLALQLLALPFISIQYLCFQGMVSAGALRAQSLVVALNLIVNVAMNLILVPRIGIQGANLAAISGGVVATGACIATLRWLGLRPGLLAAGWRPLLASTIMLGVVLATRARLPVLLVVPIGALTFALSLWALGGAQLFIALRGRR